MHDDEMNPDRDFEGQPAHLKRMLLKVRATNCQTCFKPHDPYKFTREAAQKYCWIPLNSPYDRTCLACAEHSMGRKITIQDLTDDPINNWLIRKLEGQK